MLGKIISFQYFTISWFQLSPNSQHPSFFDYFHRKIMWFFVSSWTPSVSLFSYQNRWEIKQCIKKGMVTCVRRGCLEFKKGGSLVARGGGGVGPLTSYVMSQEFQVNYIQYTENKQIKALLWRFHTFFNTNNKISHDSTMADLANSFLCI